MLKKDFKFIWRKELNYLGIKLANSMKKIYKLNYIPLLNDIATESKRLISKLLSWIGRINILKMVILPKITYKFQMLSVALPHQYLRKLKSIILKVIWKNKKSRISFSTLKQDKKRGGLAAPDIQHYYKSVILSRVAEWVGEKNEKRWVNI